MLYFDRTAFLKEFMLIKQVHQKGVICHYWCFLNKSFKFQPNVCTTFCNLLMMSMNLSDISILNIKGADYHCIISGIRKSDVINLMQNTDLTEKSGKL